VAAVVSGLLLNAGVGADLEPLVFVACMGLYGFLAMGLGQVAEEETSRLLVGASILFQGLYLMVNWEWHRHLALEVTGVVNGVMPVQEYIQYVGCPDIALVQAAVRLLFYLHGHPCTLAFCKGTYF